MLSFKDTLICILYMIFSNLIVLATYHFLNSSPPLRLSPTRLLFAVNNDFHLTTYYEPVCPGINVLDI